MPDPMGGAVGRPQRSPTSTRLPRVPGSGNLALHSLRTGSPPWSPNSPSHTLNESTGGKPCQAGHGQHHPCFPPTLGWALRQSSTPMLGGTQCGHWTPAPVHTRNPQGEWAGLQIRLRGPGVPGSHSPRHKHRDTW